MMKTPLAILTTSLILSPALLPAATPAPQKPNVVFILADDLGYYDLSQNGSQFFETPNIDALAKRGLRFEQFYSASPVCSPSRAAIMTGLFPARIGITEPDCHLPQAILEKHLVASAPPSAKALQAVSLTRLMTNYYTLAKAFKADGYVTAHFGKWHLGPPPYSPLQQGFDLDIPHTPGSGPGPYQTPFVGGYFYPFNVWKNHGKPGDNLEDDLSEAAAQFIARNKDHPFFLNYWAFEVHAPWQAKPAQIKKYRAKAAKLPPDYPQRNPVYAGMVETLDDAVGRLVAALDKAGVLDHTIIIFTSDNGPYQRKALKWMPEEYTNTPVDSAYPFRAGKGSIYDGGTRVPLIVVWPGRIKPGSKTEALGINTDFFPTFADLFGWKLPAEVHFDGVSLRSVLEQNTGSQTEILDHFPHPPYGVTYETMPAPTPNVPASSLRQGDWKIVRLYCDNPDQTDRYELYNLAIDPGETHDLAAAQPERVKALAARLNEYLQETHATIPLPNPAYKLRPKQNKVEPAGPAKIQRTNDPDPNP